MDFTQLDNILHTLEKLQSLRPPSPPVVINGHLGVWRTIRHNRVFLELLPNGVQGKVLIGPPSMVGYAIKDVPDETWAGMTPRATLKEFKDFPVASNGVDTLKQAIIDATGPEDTRREAVKDLDEPLQLVPMARRTGFTDDEIKQALSGTAPNKALEPKPNKGRDAAEPAPTRTTVIGQPKSEKPENPSTEQMVDGALALIADPAVNEGEEADRARRIGERLDKIWPRINEDLVARKVKSMAEGLKSGVYTVSDVTDMLKKMRRNKDALTERNTPTREEINTMEDHRKIKEFIETFDARVEKLIDKALNERGKQFSGETGQKIIEEAKEEAPDLPKKLEEILEENKRLRQEAQEAREQQSAELKAERARAKKEAEEAQRRQEEAAALRAAEQKRERAEADRRAAQQQQRAEAQRRAVREALSASEKDRLQVEAVNSLLGELISDINSERAKRDLKKVRDEIKSGSYNRSRVLLMLYRILQWLLALIPGI